MWWQLFQLVVVGLVMSANVYWQLTPNAYVAGITGAGVAYCLTWLLLTVGDWLRQLARRDHRSVGEEDAPQHCEAIDWDRRLRGSLSPPSRRPR